MPRNQCRKVSGEVTPLPAMAVANARSGSPSMLFRCHVAMSDGSPCVLHSQSTGLTMWLHV
eukprot:15123628-Alexandrium_andersonii.AAC.1